MKNILTKMLAKGTQVCVGIDPHPDKLPFEFHDNSRALRWFSKAVIEAVKPLVGCVKIQSAFFEAQGGPGMVDLENVMMDARDNGLATILDYKRGDIPDTAEYYVKAGIDFYGADAVTIVPWMGESCIRTFVERARKFSAGVFVVVAPTSTGHEPWLEPDALSYLWNMVARISDENVVNGFGDVGAVVGASNTWLPMWRDMYPHVPFLVPGVGAQGGTMEKLCGMSGLVINGSRSILFPGGEGNWKDNVVTACKQMIENGKKKG